MYVYRTWVSHALENLCKTIVVYSIDYIDYIEKRFHTIFENCVRLLNLFTSKSYINATYIYVTVRLKRIELTRHALTAFESRHY